MSESEKTVQSHCNTCKREQRQVLLKEYYVAIPDNEDGVQGGTAYQIIRCGGCGEVSFREDSQNSEDYDETGYYPTIRCYPQSESDALPVRPFVNAPWQIQDVYREVINTFNRRDYILCAAGLRAVIEGICAAKKIRSGPVKVKTKTGSKIIRRKHLKAKIDGLYEKGLITNEHRKTLHQHRFLGNEALHELEPPDKAELGIAISIVEHTIAHIWDLGTQGSALRALKERRKSKLGKLRNIKGRLRKIAPPSP